MDMAEEAAVAGDETVEAAEASSEDRNFVGDEGGVGLGSETVFLGAALSWHGVSGPFSGKPLRRRVAPIGTWRCAKESIWCVRLFPPAVLRQFTDLYDL